MKQMPLYLLGLLFAVTAQADPGRLPATSASTVARENKVVDAGAIRFQFDAIGSCATHKDSVLIIFDRYDHTGAGVIYKVYAQNEDNSITISDVPAGKYYVTIQCLGMHRDRLEKLVRIKSRKNEKMRIELEASEVFSKDKVVIPVYRPKFSDLAILKSK